MLVYAGVIVAVVLSALVVFVARRRIVPPAGRPPVHIFGAYSPVLTWARTHASPSLRTSIAARPAIGWSRLATALEILAIGGWALWVGRNLLNFDPHIWPTGTEFGIDIYAFHFWEQLRQCALCSLWNGMLNGGAPFLADPFTGHLHPLPAAATLIAGVVNGAKITVVASFWLAGVSQWWIGSLIGLRRWSRLWTALAATSGAHLAARMELGSVADPLAAASATLALAASFDLALNRNRKAALRFAVILALAMLAGHGYYQIALVFWAPWVLLMILTPKYRLDPVWREFALAGAIAILLASVFLVPFLHFWPQAEKFIDPTFSGSQPFEYIPLNFVVHDWDFFATSVLGKTPYPYLHPLFIGWPAVLLAVVGLALGKKKDRRLLLALSLGALTMMWLASGVPFRWLVGVAPFLARVRHVAHMASLAVPAVLALAGYGLDRLLDLPWPRWRLTIGSREARSTLSISAAWLLAIPLLTSLRTADDFDQNFMVMLDVSSAYEEVARLETPSLEWVTVPFGEHFWIEVGLDDGLKLTDALTPFWWADRKAPLPLLEATRDDRPADLIPVDRLDDVPVYLYPENIYAGVESASGTVPCKAQGIGGRLTVRCDSDGGNLVVRENAWDGWSATVNGTPARLGESRWLTVTVPPGPVEVRFRYRPADALIGVLLSLAGVGAVLVLWRRERRRAPREQLAESSASRFEDGRS